MLIDYGSVQIPSVSDCRNYSFSCGNGLCIPLAEKCDGVDNCGNGHDESDMHCGRLGTQLKAYS